VPSASAATTNNSIDAKSMPYPDNWSYLSDELILLDMVLRFEIARQRFIRPQRQNDQYKGLVLFDEDMDFLLENRDAPFYQSSGMPDGSPELRSMLAEINRLESRILERRSAGSDAGMYPALPRLARIFGLSRLEERCVIVCLAPELDLKYERLYAYLNDDITRKKPNVGLMLNLMSRSPEEKARLRQLFDQRAALFHYGILQPGDADSFSVGRDVPLLSMPLRLDGRIVDYLMDIDRIDSSLDSIVTLERPSDHADSVERFAPEGLTKQICEFIQACFPMQEAERRNVAMHLYGPHGAGKMDTIRGACRELGLPLIVVELGKIAVKKRPLPEILWRIGREALLQQGVLCLNGIQNLTDINEEDKKSDALNLLFESMKLFSPLTFILGIKPWQPEASDNDYVFIGIEVKVPDGRKRRHIWKQYSHSHGFQLSDPDAGELAAKFRFTPGRIKEAVRTARSYSLWSLENRGTITREHIYSACRAQSNSKLGTLARKIVPLYVWSDIVLPHVQRAMLREICSQVRYHHIVYDDWKFDRKVSLGKGLTILFSGPSGTGKTMAAEIIANELGLELFRIDLSQIVSKYIGETEKNLDRIFTEAGDTNSILFFDEADALFGKRSEVRDAHDRYANIEIAYLLQKMEEYDGITILATNLRQNMDEAFLRRLRFSVDFPFPDERQRELIWRNIFPPAAPIGADIDFPFLAARFRLSGGNIRNIALTAAFYAAEESSDIRMRHIIIAAKREYQKIGKLCVKGDFGEYYYLIEEGGTV